MKDIRNEIIKIYVNKDHSQISIEVKRKIIESDYKLLHEDERQEWKSPQSCNIKTEIRLTNQLGRSIDLFWMN